MQSKQSIFYSVGALVQEHPVAFLGKEIPLQMTWADGMIGVLPVFDSPQAAEKYSHGRFQISAINTTEKKLKTKKGRKA